MLHSKSPIPRLILKDTTLSSNSKFRMQTPPINLPMYPKFSSQLFNKLPSNRVTYVVSYSSLLKSQNESPRLQEMVDKKQVVTYTTQSKIHEKTKKSISINRLKFSIEEVQLRKSPIMIRPKKYVKSFKKFESKSKDFRIDCHKAKLLKHRRDAGKN